tara:strand:- start:93452 stop:93976 length:525 start_codon:yes stop_codon:yes gene_type:complete
MRHSNTWNNTLQIAPKAKSLLRDIHSTSENPVLRRIILATHGTWTDEDSGLYIFPDIDADKAANFVTSLQGEPFFEEIASLVKDLLFFYDIDGTGREGIAITRSAKLVNNNIIKMFDLCDIIEISLKDSFLFWSEISLKVQGDKQFQQLGYLEKHPGRILTQILNKFICKNFPF